MNKKVWGWKHEEKGVTRQIEACGYALRISLEAKI